MQRVTTFFLVSLCLLGINSESQNTFDRSPLADTALLPFYEDWSSGSFATNNWSFPNGQSNWQIWNALGNPEPAAKFGGKPQKNNYSYSLESGMFRGDLYNCSDIVLEFDLKLVNLISSNTEKLTVEYFVDSTWHVATEFGNEESMEWAHQKLILSLANTGAFSVRFRVHGINSARYNAWYIDNVDIHYTCLKPENLEGYGYGYKYYLDWDPVYCASGNPSAYIFDDGSAENGWAINPGYLVWLGTEFPIEASATGVIQSVDVWFGWGPSSPGLTVDIFDENHTLLGSSDPFSSPSEEWLTIPLNDIPYNGHFFAMVKWDMLATGTNYFGYDENGPYASQNLAWYYDGTTWSHMSQASGTVSGVFMIRANVLQFGEDEASGESDFMYQVGFNVFRSSNGMQGPFVKRNSDYISASEYIDPDLNFPCGTSGNPCYYFITVTYHDYSTDTLICVAGSDTVGMVYVGVQEETEAGQFKVYPNPTTGKLSFRCQDLVKCVSLISLLGIINSCPVISGNSGINHIDISAYPSGIYLLQITTESGTLTEKIVKL
ncbi:MAG: T9SS type A sorting domain-containing protein [Bacteroidales bacterium]|nr:T9SS type A sorting domain-containing protein [Bacteroidales bacterium]